MLPMLRWLLLSLLLLVSCSASESGGWSEEPNTDVEQRILRAKLQGCKQFRWRKADQGYDVDCTQDFVTWTRHRL